MWASISRTAVPRTSDGEAGAPIRGPGDSPAQQAMPAALSGQAAFGDILRWALALLPLTLQSAGARGSKGVDITAKELI